MVHLPLGDVSTASPGYDDDEAAVECPTAPERAPRAALREVPAITATLRRRLFDPFTVERDLARVIGFAMLAVLLGVVALRRL